VELDRRTGLRRAELSALQKKDIHGTFIIVRGGKGGEDRMIPLVSDIAVRLNEFVKDMTPEEEVFKLRPASISMKIKQFARKAGLSDFHTHTLRHKFATDLLESGSNIKIVQELLGHDNLNTTEVYLSIMNQGLNEAIQKLGQKVKKESLAIRNFSRTYL
jgi:integrase/recombinase XerD